MSVAPHEEANQTLARVCASLAAAASSSIAVTCVDSPVGTLLLGAQDESIALLEFCELNRIERRVTELQAHLQCDLEARAVPALLRLTDQLDGYFGGRLRTFDLPLRYRGSRFQQQVWAELMRIPYGQTCSYGAIAQRVGDPGAMRAVGAANHHNPIAIVIPCHRVVNANGDIGGYGGEVWRKRWLLDLECGQSQLAF
jgi:O-6-methylguanine DNA methyltransferase